MQPILKIGPKLHNGLIDADKPVLGIDLHSTVCTADSAVCGSCSRQLSHYQESASTPPRKHLDIFLFFSNNMPTQGVGYQIKTIKLIGIQFYLSYEDLFLFLVPASDPRPPRRVTMTQACNLAVSSCFFSCLNILMLTRSPWGRLRNKMSVNPLLQCSTCWFMFLACLQGCCPGPECCNDHLWFRLLIPGSVGGNV